MNFFEGSWRRAHAPLFPLYPVSAESNLIISLLSMMNYFSTTRLFALSQRYKMEILDNLKLVITNFEVFQSCPPSSDQLLDCHLYSLIKVAPNYWIFVKSANKKVVSKSFSKINYSLPSKFSQKNWFISSHPHLHKFHIVELFRSCTLLRWIINHLSMSGLIRFMGVQKLDNYLTLI